MIQKLACHSQCATCFGPSQSECLSCAPGRRLEINVCTRCEDTPGLKTSPFNPAICDEICGDGLYLKLSECEDGNLANGDGCSSHCSIEAGFVCGADTSEGPFWCSLEGPPTLLSLEISEDLQVKIVFSEPLETPAPITLSDFQLLITTSLG